MFAFPVSVASDLVRNNLQSQFSLCLNLSRSAISASMRLGELNTHAGSKLMEESTTAMAKAMQLRTLTDVQSFITEQSQVTANRIQGYGQNLLNIMIENALDLGRSHNAPSIPRLTQAANTDQNAAQKDAVSTGQYETDPHPSALVEQLVASVVNNDADKLH
jgi:hypothetical protein